MFCIVQLPLIASARPIPATPPIAPRVMFGIQVPLCVENICADAWTGKPAHVSIGAVSLTISGRYNSALVLWM